MVVLPTPRGPASAYSPRPRLSRRRSSCAAGVSMSTTVSGPKKLVAGSAMRVAWCGAGLLASAAAGSTPRS
ncbi:hypothetical protein KCV87_09025 [Actinosynnema pretiosum subsp. pretiosum]|uniref:Uncharacterized protein n=1 Tax=Actinosynnema pretiosum subsp. pretiosum TaxID=103721 RepID=A0AA45L9M7_9PSEU|nr:hypothetical protein KCV87_09025 [Actinosynnema pretiosum subsp. pretiosum]